MISYRDTLHGLRSRPPPGLEGAADLQMAEDVKGRLWCVGDPLRLCGAPDRVWIDLEDGWQVRMTKEGPEPESLAYVTPWAGHVPIRDGEGRAWKAPRILSQSGDTIFRVRYGGKSWLPILSEAQQAAESCARAARASFLSTEREVPREAACAWAESFLRVLHPISPGAIAALGLLDDPLIVGVLKVAAGQVDD